MTARLRDARFFWEADRKATLESRLDRLHTLLFHKKLGSYRDKAERIEPLARVDRRAKRSAQPADAAHAATAARLAKADLTTDMVFEFTELQGTMGGIYAREEGLPEAGLEGDLLPVPAGRRRGRRAADAAAARGGGRDLGGGVAGRQARHVRRRCSRAGERATGSRDPFGLRRADAGRRAAS